MQLGRRRQVMSGRASEFCSHGLQENSIQWVNPCTLPYDELAKAIQFSPRLKY